LEVGVSLFCWFFGHAYNDTALTCDRCGESMWAGLAPEPPTTPAYPRDTAVVFNGQLVALGRHWIIDGNRIVGTDCDIVLPVEDADRLQRAERDGFVTIADVLLVRPNCEPRRIEWTTLVEQKGAHDKLTRLVFEGKGGSVEVRT
jgi:hypothetical protein